MGRCSRHAKEADMKENTERRDVHQEITDQILAAMERGAEGFEMPWHRGGVTRGRPANALSGRPYRGINVLTLWIAAQANGYGSGYWGTYKHWQELGAQVRKGEKASMVFFYKQVERSGEDGESGEGESGNGTYLLARSYPVFNADQVKGWIPPKKERKSLIEVSQEAEGFVRSTGAEVRHGGDQAYYESAGDYIVMPDRERFRPTKTRTGTEGYYATLLHELTHWTGHPDRMNRDLSGRFGEDACYAMEELVAELGAAFLCADLGVSNGPRADHAGYVAEWLKVLKKDKKAIFVAASRAHQAVEYLVELQPEAKAAA